MGRPMGNMPQPVALPRQQWSLIAGFAILLFVGIASALVGISSRAQNEKVQHTLDVQAQANRLLIALIDAETGQRGYLLTGVQEYYDRYAVGRDNSRLAYERLLELTEDNPGQQAQVVALQVPIGNKLGELKRTTDLVRDGHDTDAVAIIRTNYGKHVMDGVRARIGRIVGEEGRLLAARRRDAERQDNWLLALTVIGVFAAALLGANAIGRMRRYSEGLEAANAAIAQVNAGLEAAVAERTADLKEANDEIQRFAYIVSHDLRAPLVNIMGFTSELEQAQKEVGRLHREVIAKAPDLITDATRAAVEVDMVEAIGFIRTSTERMDRLIGSILKLSRDGQRNLAPEPLDLAVLVGNLARNVGHQLDEAGGELHIGPLPAIVGDRLSLEQILGNLIDNAVKYRSPQRPLRVDVSGHAAGRDVVITVGDNGRGIAPADHGRVFDLFRRAGAQDQKGDGIGLASVRALARRLGGSITLVSVLGEGSTFTVTLPADAGMAVAKENI